LWELLDEGGIVTQRFQPRRSPHTVHGVAGRDGPAEPIQRLSAIPKFFVRTRNSEEIVRGRWLEPFDRREK
jgi:hypothetical protein